MVQLGGMNKTTRAFRTIGEASEELGLQPHVLRFWESKFSQIQPMKRGGGRRFYRAEDIEFIRGIKKLLHDEKHPIKDVQKLIKRNGAQSVIELGRSVERASRDRKVKDTVLVPQRILQAPPPETVSPVAVVPKPQAVPEPVAVAPVPQPEPQGEVRSSLLKTVKFEEPSVDRESLQDALGKLQALKTRWSDFKDEASEE